MKNSKLFEPNTSLYTFTLLNYFNSYKYKYNSHFQYLNLFYVWKYSLGQVTLIQPEGQKLHVKGVTAESDKDSLSSK